MNEQRGCRIAVIGGGVTGVLTAIHLLWRAKPGERVYLIEKSDRLGPGLAYRTSQPRHLVNVRVDNMSAFADEPTHLARWLERLPAEEREAAGERTLAGTFIRREVYGRYIQEQLSSTITRLGGAQNLYIVNDQATALRPDGGAGLRLETQMGRSFEVDAAVLAVGNFPPSMDGVPGVFSDPWDPAAVDGLDPARPILLVGTGLTMIDVTLAVLDRGFEGPILSLSRRGLLPHGHAPSSPWDDLHIDAEDRRSLLALMAAVRREVGRAAAAGIGWRSVVDALRPHVQLLWQELSPADRQRFLRHVRPWWDIHRHRAAPPVAAAIETARRRGQLRLLRGRVVGMERRGRDVAVDWRPCRSAEREAMLVQRVINCTGPMSDIAKVDDPLIRQLVDEGIARPDPQRLGLDTTRRGALVGRDGTAWPQLFGAGPVTRAMFWEITSVPDIRAQAEQVAESVLAAARRTATARLVA